MTTAPERGRQASFSPVEAPRAGADFVPGGDFFRAIRPPFGPESLMLGIGPLRIRLEGLDRAQADAMRARFRPFVDEGGVAAIPDLTIRLTRAGVDSFLVLPPSGSEVYRLGRRTRDGARDYWSYEFAGTLDPARGRAELALVAASGPLFSRGLENFLRSLTASFIVERGGLLMHAAGVVRDGRAWIFFGPSGSGKTTVTHLSPGDVILSDDMSLVVPDGDAFRAAGIPFGMVHHHVPDTRGAYPIAALVRLVQSPDVRRERLTGARALAEVAACLPFVSEDGGESAMALDTAGRLLDQVPAWRLFFRKDDSFWKVLQES